MSRELRIYLEQRHKTMQFVSLYQSFVLSIPEILNHLPTLRTGSSELFAIGDLEKTWHGFAAAVSIPEFKRTYAEFLLCRSVDAFEYYLASILSRLYIERSDTLKATGQKVGITELLESGSIDEAVRRVAELQVTNLMFKGLNDLLRYLQDKHGVEVSCPADDLKRALECIEVRHIIVHNAGLVSTLFVSRTSRSDLKVGQSFPLTIGYVNDGTDSLDKLANTMDQRFVTHFRLKCDINGAPSGSD